MNATKTFLWTCALVCFLGFEVQGGGDKLVSQLPGKAAPVTKLTVGQDFVSQPGQKRKFALGDVTVLVNQGTTGKYPAKGEIFLTAGEVYVEAKNFLVKTGQRQIHILKGKVAVRVDKQGTSVIVTHGEATVAGVKKTIQAGYQLPVGAAEPAPLPRASHALEWTKDLVSALPLVPASSYNGGALLARDPDGQDAKISLRKFHIDVHIEDGFARTTIDQTYFNQENVQLEGTFYFPLPPDASLSRLAMYVDGRLMEGGMAERDYARDVYESIRYANRDPALLEWVDGSTFKMRIFPLEPRTEKRIILSYAQRLPSVFGDTTYRFAGGHSLQKVDQFAFQARIHGGAKLTWHSPSHELDSRKDGNDLVLTANAKNAPTDRDVTLTLSEPRQSGKAPIAARFNSSNIDNSQYLMVRYRPDLQISNPQSKIKNPLWVFLFESSGDRDPLLGRVQIEVIRNLLGNLAEGDKFLVASAGTHVKYHAAAPQEVNPANIDGAVKFLEESHLIGALDLGNALTEVCKNIPDAEREAYFVHVGSGIAAMGERRDAELAQMLAKVRYVGIGVGHRWNRSFMKLAAEKTGGYFTQINPDEPIAWRVFDLWSTLATPRLMNIQVEGDAGQKFLLFEQTVAEGEEICALAKVAGNQKMPASLIIRGLVDGKAVEYKVAVKDVAPQADYLPRTWAKLEIERLLAEDALKNRDAIVALSKAQYVVTPFTSLMVLEHEDLYTQYKVDRNRQDRWALYQSPDKIPVVYEPLPGEPDPKALLAGGKQKADVVARTVLTRGRALINDQRKTGGATQEVLEQVGDLLQDPRPLNLGNGSLGTVMLDPKTPIRLTISDGHPVRVLALQPPIEGAFIGAGRGALAGAASGHLSPSPKMIPFIPSPSTEPIPKFDTERLGVPLVSSTTITATGLSTQTLSPSEGMWLRSPSFNPEKNSPQVLQQVVAREVSIDSRKEFGVSENLRQAKGEWHRFWSVNQPGHLTPTRVRGGIMPDAPFPQEMKLVAVSADFFTKNAASSDQIFFDLLAYAPGMNTSQADIDAVVEAEALPSRFSKTGRIDPAARELLARARLAGWHTVTVSGEGKQTPVSITFDGVGRYAYESTSSMGIKERVVCDGQTLVHLYPQLFVGAKRTVSRAHRADFAEMVPWYLPPAEDLAQGVDLKVIAPGTLALVPHFERRIAELASAQDLASAAGSGSEKKLAWLRQHLVFGEDGKLAERQVVQMPEQKVLARQILDMDGTVRILSKDNKEVAVRKGKLTPADQAPNLAPDTKSLVVLPLPYRTPEHVLQTLKAEKKNVQELRIAEALPLLAAYVGAGNAAKALEVFRTCFYAREQRQLGYYVLLASCGVNLDSENANVLAEHLDEPLAQYLALHSSPVLRKHASQWAVNTVNWKEDFLQHLSQTHALFQRWQNDNVTKGDPARVRADRQKALAYVRANKDSAFGFAMLCLMQDKAKLDKDFYRELAEGWRLFEGSAAVGYAARYEVARCLYKSGQLDLTRKSFEELYESTLKDDTLPAIDEDFRWALVGEDGKPDAWSTLMRASAQKLITQKRRPDVLILAAQCWRLGDEPLANKLLSLSLDGLGDGKEKTDMTLEVISFLTETNQIPEAADKLRPLTGDAELTKKFSLWRLAANLAESRNASAQALDYLEKALAVEYQNLPEVIDLKQVRADYGKLLEVYTNLAEAMVILKIKPAPDFVDKIIRAADRWRALDRESSTPSEVAAKILQKLGQHELAWDYLTTPIALNPTAAEPWVNMARELGRTGDLVLAERAYKAASEAEPTNAQILWDRAQNLRRAGKEREAQPLFRRMADGTWQPRFQGLVNQARGELK